MGIIASGATATPITDLFGPITEFASQLTDLIGLRVAPPIEVDTREGTFYRLAKEEAASLPRVERAENGGYNRRTQRLESDTYRCEAYGLETPLDNLATAEYEKVLSAAQVFAELDYETLLKRHEIRVAAQLINETNFPTSGTTGDDVSSSGPWATVATSNPVGNIQSAKETMFETHGREPDMIIVPYSQRRNIANSANVREGFKYASLISAQPVLSEDVLRDLFEIPNVFIGKATHNIAKEGQPYSVGRAWNPAYVFLGYLDDSPFAGTNQLARLQTIRTFAFQAFAGLATIEAYEDSKTDHEVVRVKQCVDEKLMVPGAGYLLKVG